MRVVYFGSGDFAVPPLRALVNSRHEVLLVVTQPDRPAGRGKVLQPTPTAEQAEEDGLPLLKCEDVNAPAVVEQLISLKADIGVVAAFGQKMSEPVRSAFTEGCINLHASLLPKHRGASPISAAILAGDTLTGVSVFRLVDRMDAGPVLLTRQTSILSTETTGELHDRLSRVGCDAVKAAMDLLEKNPQIPGEPQDDTQTTYAKKLKKCDGFLQFTRPAEELARLVRAMSPWPGARCRYVPAAPDGKAVELTLLAATSVPTGVSAAPGTIAPMMTVATGEGTLEIQGVQPAGGRAMSWQEFVNGRHVQAGDRLESLASE